MDARDILRNVGILYASMTSYSDNGEARAMFANTGHIRRTQFSTLFRKPSLFRFECLRPHPHEPLSHMITRDIVGFDGTTAYRRQKYPVQSETTTLVENLSLAIAGAVATSNGAAHTVARLLIPGLEGFSILEFLNIRLNEDTQLDGLPCYSLTGSHPSAGEHDLWIEKDSLLLRKWIYPVGPVSVEIVRENIRVNEPIETGLFAIR